MSFYVKIPNKTICQKSCQNDDKNTHFVPKNNVKPLFWYLVGYTREMIKNETCQKWCQIYPKIIQNIVLTAIIVLGITLSNVNAAKNQPTTNTGVSQWKNPICANSENNNAIEDYELTLASSGLGAGTTLTKAALEAVAYQTNDLISAMAQDGMKPTNIKVTAKTNENVYGGTAKSFAC